MKQFIYYDTDGINSLVAQISGGLEESLQKAQERGHLDETGESESLKGNVKGGISVPIAKVGGEVSGENSKSKRTSDNEILREIYTIKAHDILFNRLLSNLEETNKINSPILKMGSFINGVEDLQIIDLDYIMTLFNDKAFSEYVKQNIIKNPLKTNESSNKKKIEEEYNRVKNEIESIASLIPYKRMALSSRGFLIPLDDKYFRYNPNLLGLKYGGSFHYIGYITNIIDETPNVGSSNNLFKTILDMINQVLFKVLPTDSKRLYIVHPLGIYFEP